MSLDQLFAHNRRGQLVGVMVNWLGSGRSGPVRCFRNVSLAECQSRFESEPLSRVIDDKRD